MCVCMWEVSCEVLIFYVVMKTRGNIYLPTYLEKISGTFIYLTLGKI